VFRGSLTLGAYALAMPPLHTLAHESSQGGKKTNDSFFLSPIHSLS
jgi:hypothetical protein